jgi:hypothetical protein
MVVVDIVLVLVVSCRQSDSRLLDGCSRDMS